MKTENRMRESAMAACALAMLLTPACAVDDEVDTDEMLDEHGHAHDHEQHRQTEDEALADDIAIAALELGIPEAEIARKSEFQRAFSEYADEIVARYPERVSAIWMDDLPTLRGHIRFVDEVPADAQLDEGWLTTLDPADIELSGGGLIAQADHAQLARLAAEALADQGYTDAVTFIDPASGSVEIELQLLPGAARPSTARIAGLVRDRVAEVAHTGELDLLVSADVAHELDVKLTVLEGTGPIVTPTHARGGNWVRDDGFAACTSGWSVFGPNGDGIITAGHCSGLNELLETNGTINHMSFQYQVYGAGGDAEYHTTNHVELPEFFADSNNIRAVTSVRSTQSMIGASVCMYGRSSNYRSCNKTVTATGVAVLNGNLVVTHLTRTTNNTSIPGDSGGGWSWSSAAFGLTHGYDGNGNSYFMPADYAQIALSVAIKLQ